MALLGEHIDRIIYIFSSGRTGTTAIARYLNEGFDNVCARHEPPPTWRLRVASNKYLAKRMTDQRMIDTFLSARQHIIRQVTQPVYVENGFLNGYLDFMDRLFDKPRIIHITRDARTYVRSALNFGTQRGIKRFMSDYIPHWHIKPENLETNPPRTWRQMSSIERYAWYWKTINTHLSRGEELFGDRYLRIRFEQLLTPDGLRRMAAWIGLTERPGKLEPLLAEKVNPSQGRDVPPWNDWPPQDRDIVMQHCAQLMRQYGYPT